jgi:hypothetical protein
MRQMDGSRWQQKCKILPSVLLVTARTNAGDFEPGFFNSLTIH